MRISIRRVERCLVTACVFLVLVVFCHLFIKGCGGPFPERVRGPLFSYRGVLGGRTDYTKLGDLSEDERELAKHVELPVD